MRLEGRVAAVTGGASGISEAICIRLAQEGAKVAVLDLNLSGAQLTADLAGGIAVELDVSDSAAMDAAVDRVEAQLGALDVFVNNAGASGVAHLERVGPRLEQQRGEAATGTVTTALDALVRLSDDE